MDSTNNPTESSDDYDPANPPLPDTTSLEEGNENQRRNRAREYLSGAIEQHTDYADLTDAELVKLVEKPEANVTRNVSAGAMVELNRRHTVALREHAVAMKKSSCLANRLASAMFVLAGLNLIILVWLALIG